VGGTWGGAEGPSRAEWAPSMKPWWAVFGGRALGGRLSDPGGWVGRGSSCLGRRGDGLAKRRRLRAVGLKSEVEDGEEEE